mmetsp:Transcript_16774/g.19417  ORF Transcript_16774/g.19417 Transcript_16774/m.19417 type:complete len:342 (+) Transcript_16774:1456-2481(+)
MRVAENFGIRNPNLPKPKAAKGAASLLHKTCDWRVKEMLYSKLILLFDLFPQESVKDAFYDAAMQDFLDGSEPLRKTCAVFLAKVMYSEYLEEDRVEMIETLVAQLAEGGFNQRRCLLDFIESSIQVFSKKYWKKYCYEELCKFGHDPIPVLRIKFAKCAINLWPNFTRHDADISFLDGVDTLLEDVSEDVQEAGLRLNRCIIKGYDSSQEARLEEEEKCRLSYELALKEREKREYDEIQKKKDEEKEKKEYMDKLTDQMRMKKRYLKLPGFQAKLFTKKSLNGKGRSSKRGSFTIGNRSKTSKPDVAKKNSMTSISSAGKIGSSSTPNSRGLNVRSKDRK